MNKLSVIPGSLAASRRYNEADLAGAAVQIMLDVTEAVGAIRAAEEGHPIRACDLSFSENFAEALGMKPDTTLTAERLPCAFSLGIESDSDEKTVRFSVPDGMLAELVRSGTAVALKVASLEEPAKPILLISEDFRVYADFVHPGLFAAASVSPEHKALLHILTESNEALGRWIVGAGIEGVVAQEDPEARFRLFSAVRWTWEDWDQLNADLGSAERLISHVGSSCSEAEDIAEVLKSLEANAELIREFRLMVSDRVDEFMSN